MDAEAEVAGASGLKYDQLLGMNVAVMSPLSASSCCSSRISASKSASLISGAAWAK